MTDLGIGNYRGNLQVKEDDGNYYWAVECDLDNPERWDWEDISKALYDALILFNETREAKT